MSSSSASSKTVIPRCPHFDEGCGGCSWQHLAYPEQLRQKTQMVDGLVRAVLPRAPDVLPTIPATPIDNPWGYRHKVHFVFGEVASAFRRKEIVMGHYMRGSRRILPVRECPVHDPRGNDVAFAFRDALVRTGVRADAVQGIAVRVGAGTQELMTTVVVTTDTDKRLRAATRALTDKTTSLHVNLHPARDGFIFGRETRRISGPERMRERVAGVSFLVSPTAFFQTNIAAAEILVKLVLESCGADPGGPRLHILDLYAGAGLFALPLAAAGHTVVAVEENRAAVADGEASRRLNRIPAERCTFVAAPVEKWRPLKGRPVPDVVILDPPREGCTGAVIHHVFGKLQPSKAIYVSCNPEALAGDLALIALHGYAVQSLQPVDMFPHTAHVETVVTLALADDKGPPRIL